MIARCGATASHGAHVYINDAGRKRPCVGNVGPFVTEIRATREVCTDCGAMSAAVCPWGKATCSECSAARDIYARPDLTQCPAHGAYIASED